MIWLVNPPQNEENRAEYLHLVRRTTAMQLPVAIAREILQQLANRALSTPSLSHFAVEVAWAWFVQNPMTVTVDTLAMSWHACFSLRDLKNIEYTMDVGMNGKSPPRSYSSSSSVCWIMFRPVKRLTSTSPTSRRSPTGSWEIALISSPRLARLLTALSSTSLSLSVCRRLPCWVTGRCAVRLSALSERLVS